MKSLIDFSSRFRILKGGKVSLVVSALALGSIINVAYAEADILITENLEIPQIYGATSPTNQDNGQTVEITDSGSIIADGDHVIIFRDTYSDGAIDNNGYTLTNYGTIKLTNTPEYSTIYVINNNFMTTINNYKDIIYVGSEEREGSSAIRASYSTTINNFENAKISATINGDLDSGVYAIYGNYITANNDGIIEGNLNFSGTMTNIGKISLPYNANGENNAFIETYTNNSTGILEIGLQTDGTTTNYSQLKTINATFEDGSTIRVVPTASTTQENANLLINTTLEDVVIATNLLTIVDTLNIESTALLDFERIITQGDDKTIDLKVTQTKSISDTVTTKTAPEYTNAKGAAKALDTIMAADNSPGMNTVINQILLLPTNEAVAKAVEETTPQTATSSVSASNHVAQGISNIVTQRQNVNLGAGINSGDEMFVEKNIWFKPYGSIGSQNDKDGINGFDINTYGLAFGVDGEYEENQTFGLGFFYTNANVEVNNVTQSTDLDVFSLVAYGSNPIIDDKTKFMYQLGYAIQKNDSSRFVSLTSDTATSKYTSKTASVDLKVLRDYRVSEDLLLQPMVSTTYRHFSNPSYSEIGAGALNLDVQKFTTTELLVGLGTMAHYKLNDNSKIIANANVDYDLHDRTTTVTSSYQGASGVTFDTDGIDNGRWSYDVGVGYERNIDDLSNINFSYNYQGKGSDYSNNVISAKYTYKF